MKNFLLALTLLLACIYTRAEEVRINVSGNGYVTSHHDGAQITKNGIADWTNSESDISVYFYLQEPTKTKLSILAKGHSEIKVSYGTKSFKVKLNSDHYALVPVGRIDVKKPGHVRIDFSGIKKKGETFGEIKQVVLDNVNGECNYITDDFSDYFGRRGPSVHLGYKLPEGDTEWFYNEVTVPEEGEVLQSYYMGAGFGEGYFGMQYNTPTERRVLFSVWSPFNTEDPKHIPDEQKIKMLRRGKDVHIGEFGDEGSGGQSYLNYPWKAGNTYKFLMQVTPDGNNNTIYTAYFYTPDEDEWRLIASFLRPNTSTWYKHAHSFLENFNPEQGYLPREVYFGNQWARSKEGNWTPLTEATFTNDATAIARKRMDYQGGTTDDNRYYLKMGGFFDESVPRGTKFHITPSASAPVIDWEALKKL